MLTIATWWWGQKYDLQYVGRLHRSLRRYIGFPFRFICVTDKGNEIRGLETIQIKQSDRYLLEIPGCFARLRMFDPEWQKENKIEGRLACIDLDVVITGRLDSLFDRTEDFVILQGANSVNPCPYNGSLWMLNTGSNSHVWNDFTLERAKEMPYHDFPDDQGWMWQKIPNAAGWQVETSGIWAFRKRNWPRHDNFLPNNARMVCFPGARDPRQFSHIQWIARHWR
jgi:hypothetical protein